MPRNYTPTWQSWTPLEGIYYWERLYLMHLVDPLLEPDPIKIERLLTAQITQPLWNKIESLNVDVKTFLNAFVEFQSGNKINQELKKSAVDAENVLNAISSIFEVYKTNRSYFALCSEEFKALNNLAIKANNDLLEYQKQQNVVAVKDKKLIDSVYFCRQFADFFEKNTQKPRHELTAICATIAFSKEFTPDKVKQTVNRRNKNS